VVSRHLLKPAERHARLAPSWSWLCWLLKKLNRQVNYRAPWPSISGSEVATSVNPSSQGPEL
jgi:hypothetical protein